MGLKKDLIDWLTGRDEDADDESGIGEADHAIENDDETPADEIEAEGDTDEGEAETDAEEADTEGEGETTPGTAEEGSAELDDLRATIREQAAMIETYRNTIAELGGVDPIAAEDDAEAELDTEDDSAEDAVAAFETDYAARKAILADIKQGD
jgi:hypothetical protein